MTNPVKYVPERVAILQEQIGVTSGPYYTFLVQHLLLFHWKVVKKTCCMYGFQIIILCGE